MSDIAYDQRVHIHCNRGRDRTGAAVAIVVRMLSDVRRLPTRIIDDLIECDYEKTSTIRDEHIGHMKDFLRHEFKRRGGTEFFVQRCQIDRDEMALAARRFVRF